MQKAVLTLPALLPESIESLLFHEPHLSEVLRLVPDHSNSQNEPQRQAACEFAAEWERQPLDKPLRDPTDPNGQKHRATSYREHGADLGKSDANEEVMKFRICVFLQMKAGRQAVEIPGDVVRARQRVWRNTDVHTAVTESFVDVA